MAMGDDRHTSPARRPLAVGDLVKVYERAHPPVVGRVHSFTEDGCILLDGMTTGLAPKYHPKQCRRLVKKPPREWVLQGHPIFCASNYIHKPVLGPELGLGETVRVREVRK